MPPRALIGPKASTAIEPVDAALRFAATMPPLPALIAPLVSMVLTSIFAVLEIDWTSIPLPVVPVTAPVVTLILPPVALSRTTMPAFEPVTSLPTWIVVVPEPVCVVEMPLPSVAVMVLFAPPEPRVIAPGAKISTALPKALLVIEPLLVKATLLMPVSETAARPPEVGLIVALMVPLLRKTITPPGCVVWIARPAPSTVTPALTTALTPGLSGSVNTWNRSAELALAPLMLVELVVVVLAVQVTALIGETVIVQFAQAVLGARSMKPAVTATLERSANRLA